MGKNIYDLINEMDTNIEDYDKQQLTKLEEKRMMKKFNEAMENKQGTKKNYKKYISAAAVAVIAFGTLGAIPTMATTNPTMYKIATALGIEKDLTPYETIVGKEMTKDGLTIRINEVIINNNELIVSVTTTSEESIKDTYSGASGSVYINGEEINMGAYAKYKLVDDNTGHTLVTFPLDNMYEGTLDIKLVLRTPLDGLQTTPHWNYEFTANGDELRQATQTVTIDKAVDTKAGNTITLGVYEGNTVSHSISFETDIHTDNDVKIKGTDENGNEVVFEKAPITYTMEGEFVVYDEYKAVADAAKTLTLGVYVNGELEGEMFEINK